MSSACTCPYCAKPTGRRAPGAPPAHPPVELPGRPRRFRVHAPDGALQDCTLHPDGRMTTVMAGQLWVSGLSFDDMRTMNWADARIEWAPEEPAPGAPALPPTPAYEERPGW